MKCIINILFFFVCVHYACAMEAISEKEMSEVTGAIGIDIFMKGTLEAKATFQIMAWQDTDGVGGDTTDGYFGVVGASDSTITISVSDCKFSLDVGTAEADLIVNGQNAVEAGRSFVRIGLPDVETDISMSDYTVQFGDGSKLGQINTSEVSVDTIQTPDALYISPH